MAVRRPAAGTLWDIRAGARDARGLALAAMCLAVLMVQLDTTVVNLGLPAIQQGLGGTVSTLQWVLDACNLVYAALILTGGTMGDLYGHRRVFLVGSGAFAVGSLLCGAARRTGMLVASRAFTGVGAALALPASLALVTVLYPERVARARALAVWAGFNGVAWAIGPAVGAVLLEHAGWRSLFLANLPVAVVAIALTAAVVPESVRVRERRLEIPGQVLATGASPRGRRADSLSTFWSYLS